MKRKTFLILTFLSIAFFAYAEVEPWIMIPKGATANGSSSEHEDHQIVYYFNKKTGKHYAAIVEPKSQAAVALEFTGETITKEYINYPDDYIKDFSGEGNTTIKLEVIKDSETIYNKIKNNGYFICDSCTRLNHGWTYVEVAGEHREFLNPDVDTWKKEVAKLHKVLTLNEIYYTFKTDY